MPRVIKYLLVAIGLIAGTAIIFALSVYLRMRVPTILLVNEFSKPLPDVRVVFGDKIAWQGNLDLGESKFVYGFYDDGERITVSYDIEGRRISRTYYVGTGYHEALYLDGSDLISSSMREFGRE